MIYKGVEWDPRQNAKWPQNENKINIIIQITSITILQAYSSVNIYIKVTEVLFLLCFKFELLLVPPFFFLYFF